MGRRSWLRVLGLRIGLLGVRGTREGVGGARMMTGSRIALRRGLGTRGVAGREGFCFALCWRLGKTRLITSGLGSGRARRCGILKEGESTASSSSSFVTICRGTYFRTEIAPSSPSRAFFLGLMYASSPSTSSANRATIESSNFLSKTLFSPSVVFFCLELPSVLANAVSLIPPSHLVVTNLALILPLFLPIPTFSLS